MIPTGVWWPHLIRYWTMIPIFLALAGLLFAVGAEAGAVHAQQQNAWEVIETVNGLETMLDERPEGIHEEVPIAINDEFVWNLEKPFVGVLVDVMLAGYWFGLANPEVQGAILPAAELFALAVILGYFYVFYRGARRLFRW